MVVDFAGSVRPEERKDLTLEDVQVQSVKGDAKVRSGG